MRAWLRNKDSKAIEMELAEALERFISDGSMQQLTFSPERDRGFQLVRIDEKEGETRVWHRIKLDWLPTEPPKIDDEEQA